MKNHETAFTALLPMAYYTPLSSIREKPFPGLRSTMKADVIRRETPSCLQSFRSRHFTPAKRGEPLMAETCKHRMKINIQHYGNITMILP